MLEMRKLEPLILHELKERKIVLTKSNPQLSGTNLYELAMFNFYRFNLSGELNRLQFRSYLREI